MGAENVFETEYEMEIVSLGQVDQQNLVEIVAQFNYSFDGTIPYVSWTTSKSVAKGLHVGDKIKVRIFKEPVSLLENDIPKE